VRIIGGTAAGKIIKVPKGLSVRPTPDLVRQAIYNRLGEFVEDAQMLELFGGSGALSLESLSRGAKSALCVELSGKHARFIQGNHKVCGFGPGAFSVTVEDVFHALPRLANSGRKFDLIMADPPFGEKNVNKRSESLSQKLLDDEHLPDLLHDHGIFVLGHTHRDQLEITPAWLEHKKIMRHGDSCMRFLKRAQPGP
jgi:16S rRNA (guanine966-N2)-methyltransferase